MHKRKTPDWQPGGRYNYLPCKSQDLHSFLLNIRKRRRLKAIVNHDSSSESDFDIDEDANEIIIGMSR